MHLGWIVELLFNQNANLAIIKFTWISFVLPCFSKCSYQQRMQEFQKRGGLGLKSLDNWGSGGSFWKLWGSGRQLLKKICNFEVKI